jgi:hypothetical protein
MNVGDLDEVQFDLEVDGEQVRQQLARKVWERGGWATVACVFRERGSDGAWKKPKLALLRFRRAQDAWKRQAAITIDSAQAIDLALTVGGWREMLATGDEGDSD